MTDNETGPALRRAAITELGDALRVLVDHATTTEVPADDLLRAAFEIREVAALLGERVRGRSTLPSADDLLGGVRMYNPVTGGGSALAPPLHIEVVDGTAIGRCTLGAAFEGPPTFTHGGVSAMLPGFAIRVFARNMRSSDEALSASK